MTREGFVDQRQTPADDGSGEPDLDRRIDTVFAEAIEQQVSEQRAISLALDRVTEALDALHGELTELSARVEASVRREEEPRLARLLSALEAAQSGAATGAEELRTATTGVRAAAEEAATASARSAAASADAVADLRVALESAVASFAAAVEQASDEGRLRLQQDRADLRRAAEGLGRDLVDAVAAATARLDSAAEEHREATAADAAALRELASATREQVEALLARVEEQLGDVRSESAALTGELRDELLAAVDAVGARLLALHGGGVDRLDESAAGLADVAREVASAAESRLAGVIERVTAVAERLEVFDEVERARADAANEAQSALRAGIRHDAETVLADLQRRGLATLADAAERLVALGDRFERDQGARNEEALARLDRASRALDPVIGRLGQLDALVRRSVESAVEAARGTVHEEVAAVRREMDAAVAQLRRTEGHVDDVAAAVGAVQQQVQDWLSARDRRAEAERDRVVAEVLDRFAAGLSRRDARRLAGLMPELRRVEPPLPAPPPPEEAEEAEEADTPDERTCEQCGFVAKTPAGLSAHRRSHL